MAKDSMLTGAVNGSDFKNKGTSPSHAASMNGEKGPKLAGRTSSPRAQDEVTKIKGYQDLTKPTRG